MKPVPLDTPKLLSKDVTCWPLRAKAPCLEELYEAEREESILHLKVTALQRMNQEEVTQVGGVRILVEDVRDD